MLFKKPWNANITELLNGASINFCAKILATLLGLVGSLLLTRHYGAETVGNIATILSIVNVSTILALSGFDTLTLKLIPTNIKTHGAPYGTTLYKTIATIVLFHTAILFFILPSLIKLTRFEEKLNLPTSPWFPGLIIIFTSILAISSNTLRGLGDYIKYSLLDFLASGFLLFIILLSIWAHVSSTVLTYAYFAAYFLAFLLGYVLVKMQFQNTPALAIPNNKTPPRPKLGTLYNQAWPMFGVAASQILIVNIDVLCIGYFSTQTNVGIYSIYLKLVAVTAFATTAISSMFAPKVAVLFEESKTVELRKFVKQTTLFSTIAVVSLAGILLLLHQPLLNLYGGKFLNDLTTLYVLLMSTVIHSSFGAVGFFLNMTGQQRIFLTIMVLACAINLGLNIALVPTLGMMGAALATLLTTAFWNTAATVVIFRRHKFTLLPTSI